MAVGCKSATKAANGGSGDRRRGAITRADCRNRTSPDVKSLWSDAEAEALVAHYAARGVGREVALCLYGSRLLGGDKRLVLHGGGNTSVKTVLPDLFGQSAEALCIQRSGRAP